MVQPLISPGPGVSTADWFCVACGVWVSGGDFHVCSKEGTDVPPLLHSDPIHKKLNRIIELLENIDRRV